MSIAKVWAQKTNIDDIQRVYDELMACANDIIDVAKAAGHAEKIIQLSFIAAENLNKVSSEIIYICHFNVSLYFFRFRSPREVAIYALRATARAECAGSGRTIGSPVSVLLLNSLPGTNCT